MICISSLLFDCFIHVKTSSAVYDIVVARSLMLPETSSGYLIYEVSSLAGLPIIFIKF